MEQEDAAEIASLKAKKAQTDKLLLGYFSVALPSVLVYGINIEYIAPFIRHTEGSISTLDQVALGLPLAASAVALVATYIKLKISNNLRYAIQQKESTTNIMDEELLSIPARRFRTIDKIPQFIPR